MAITVVHQFSGGAVEANPATIAIPTTTTGNALIVALQGTDNPTATVSGITISPGGGTFTKVIAQAGVGGEWGGMEIWWCTSLTGGTTPTLSITTSSTVFLVVGTFEVSGLGTSTDGSTAAGPTASNAASSGSITTTNANDLLISGVNIQDTFVSADATWTNDSSSGNVVAYKIVSATGSQSYTATLSGGGFWTSAIAAFQASGAGPTPVNATVAIAAKAVSGLTVTPRVTKDATFLCAAGVSATTFRCDLGAFGHAILQGKATSSSFTGQATQLKTERATGKATFSPVPFITHNATLAIAGTATASRFNAGSNPTLVNATVHLFGFAANNIVINQFLGRATLVLRANVPLDQVSINGRATFTPNAQVSRNFTEVLRGTAKLTLTALVTGAGVVNGTLVINGRATIPVVTPRVNKGAQVVIEAGNQIFIPVEAKVAIFGKAAATFTPFVTHGPQVLIQGRATLRPNPTLGGTNNIFGGVHFAGRATARFFIPPSSVSAVSNILGRAFLTPSATNIVSLSATVHIAGRATARFAATVQGSNFNNAVVSLAGRAVFTPSQFTLVNPTVNFAGIANMQMFPGGTLRGSLAIQGFASFIPQVPKQLLQWASGNTLQYKVWQYNSESMVRVLGSSWTATSVGLSFQAVAFELTSTEAGWGS